MLLIEDKEVDIFVGSRIGSFKHIKYHTDPLKNTKKCIENLIAVKALEKDESITCMVWGDEEQNEILLGKKNQQIQSYNTQTTEFKNLSTTLPPGHLVGLARCKRKLLAAVSSGVVKIWSKKEELEVQVGKLDRMRVCPDDNTLFGTGGEENDLKVWRIGETTPVFIGKNLAHDWLQLRKPVWVSDLTFVPGEAGNVVAVCSRHGYVRLYDIRAQRRPVANVEVDNMAATCIAPSFESRQVLVGFGRGQLHQVDLRQPRLDKGYKGSVGAVTDVAAVVNDRLLVSVSLDRQLRVHNYDTKELVHKQYLTSKLSCLLVQDKNRTALKNIPDTEVKEEVCKAEEEDDLDEIFEDMEVVGEKPKKKKLHLEPAVNVGKKFKPSTEGTTEVDITQEEDAIKKLLKSTEKQKRRLDKKKKEKKAKSLFHNA